MTALAIYRSIYSMRPARIAPPRGSARVSVRYTWTAPRGAFNGRAAFPAQAGPPPDPVAISPGTLATLSILWPELSQRTPPSRLISHERSRTPRRAARVGRAALSPMAVGVVRSFQRRRAIMNQLTEREYEVAALVADGLQDKQIAYRLGIAPGTAKVHLHNIYQKLGICSRVQLALAWMKHGERT